MALGLIIYVPNQLHFPNDLGLKGLNVFNVLFLLALFVTWLRSEKSSSPTPLKGRFIFFFLALVIAFFIAQMRGDGDFIGDLTYLKTSIFYILLYFIFYHAAQDVRTIRILFVMVLFVAFVAGLEAIKEGLAYGIGHYKETHRASGPFGFDYMEANRAGVFYAMFLPLFLTVFLFYRSRRIVRLLALGGTIVLTAAIFFTYSRQSYFIAAFILLYLLFRRGILLPLLGVVLLLNYSLWVPDSAVERVEETKKTDQRGQEQLDESTESRFVIWEGALQIIQDNPWGIGLNRFKQEIKNYTPYKQGKDAHNQYVLIATEAGIQGLLAYLLLLRGMYSMGRSLARSAQNEEEKILGVGYISAFISMVLGGIYGSPLFFGEIMGNFWALTALVARYQLLVAEGKVAREKTIKETKYKGKYAKIASPA
jgi:O-antigen ligase